MMKRTFLVLILAWAMTGMASAQSVRDFWLAMPDSVLTAVNRSMRAELVAAKAPAMKTEVKNVLEGTTVLDTLTSDFMAVHISGASTMQIRRLAYKDDTIFCVVRTYMGPVADSNVSLYDKTWAPMDMKHIYDGKCIKCVKKSLVEKPDTMTLQRFEEVRAMLDPMLVRATLSAADATITFTGSVDMLNNEEKKAVGAIFVKKTFKWDGEIFKKVI